MSGKTTVMRTLERALRALASSGISGPNYKDVHRYVVNPKAVTLEELFGFTHPDTGDWHEVRHD